MAGGETQQAIEAVFRIERARLIAGLARMLRDMRFWPGSASERYSPISRLPRGISIRLPSNPRTSRDTIARARPGLVESSAVSSTAGMSVPCGTVVALLASTPAPVRAPAMFAFGPPSGEAGTTTPFCPFGVVAWGAEPVVSITSAGSEVVREGGIGGSGCCGTGWGT